MDLAINNLQRLICHKIQTNNLLFFHKWKENIWILTFPNGISVMGNAKSLVQYVNSDHRVYFQR